MISYEAVSKLDAGSRVNPTCLPPSASIAKHLHPKCSLHTNARLAVGETARRLCMLSSDYSSFLPTLAFPLPLLLPL